MSLKSKFKNNELTVGTWLSLAHPAIAEIMVQAGFDWVAVDLEHSVITVREAEELIRIIDLGGSVPLVRLNSAYSSPFSFGVLPFGLCLTSNKKIRPVNIPSH